MPRRFVVKTCNGRTYYRIPIEGGAVQYQVTTPVGFHWRHIAVVTVKDGKAGKAERYFFSTRASAVVVPFEVMGKEFLARSVQVNQKLGCVHVTS